MPEHFFHANIVSFGFSGLKTQIQQTRRIIRHRHHKHQQQRSQQNTCLFSLQRQIKKSTPCRGDHHQKNIPSNSPFGQRRERSLPPRLLRKRIVVDHSRFYD